MARLIGTMTKMDQRVKATWWLATSTSPHLHVTLNGGDEGRPQQGDSQEDGADQQGKPGGRGFANPGEVDSQADVMSASRPERDERDAEATLTSLAVPAMTSGVRVSCNPRSTPIPASRRSIEGARRG